MKQKKSKSCLFIFLSDRRRTKQEVQIEKICFCSKNFPQYFRIFCLWRNKVRGKYQQTNWDILIVKPWISTFMHFDGYSWKREELRGVRQRQIVILLLNHSPGWNVWVCHKTIEESSLETHLMTWNLFFIPFTRNWGYGNSLEGFLEFLDFNGFWFPWKMMTKEGKKQ